MEKLRQEFPLEPASVEQASALAEDFARKMGQSSRDAIRLRLLTEEAILGWYGQHLAPDFRLIMDKRLNRCRILLECDGVSYNPFEQEDEDSSYLHDLQTHLGIAPRFSYRNRCNRMVCTFPGKKMSQLVLILLCLATACLVGFAMKALLPAQTVLELRESFLDPLYQSFFRLLSSVAGPLILLSTTWGIYGIGDIGTLSRLGKDLIIRFLLYSLTVSILCCCTAPLFPLNMTVESGGGSVFQKVFQMIMDIIPSDVITPLQTNNTLQIVFCAVVLGTSMVFLNRDVRNLASWTEQISAVVRAIMEFISRLIPLLVGMIILRMILADSLMLFTSVWQLILIFAGECLAVCLAMTGITALVLRVSPLLLIKKSLPTFLIALTTASSTAALSSNLETCEKRFGIHKSLINFGLPLGMVIYKTASVVYFLLISFYFAAEFGVVCSASWIVTACILSFMLSFSSPPVPGGGTVVVMLLFARLGLPDEALAIALSMDVLFDFVLTATNMYALPLTLLHSASAQKFLDRNILKRP